MAHGLLLCRVNLRPDTMLKITRLTDEAPRLRLNVEGSITQGWVPVLRDELGRALATALNIELDFRSVSYVDSAGLSLLRGLPRDRVAIVNCAPLIWDLLQKEDV